jgi:hypothetical protein
MVVREKEVVLGAGQGGRRAAQQLARARPGLRGRMRNTLRRPTAQRSGGTQGTERVITNLLGSNAARQGEGLSVVQHRQGV